MGHNHYERAQYRPGDDIRFKIKLVLSETKDDEGVVTRVYDDLSLYKNIIAHVTTDKNKYICKLSVDTLAGHSALILIDNYTMQITIDKTQSIQFAEGTAIVGIRLITEDADPNILDGEFDYTQELQDTFDIVPSETNINND